MSDTECQVSHVLRSASMMRQLLAVEANSLLMPEKERCRKPESLSRTQCGCE